MAKTAFPTATSPIPTDAEWRSIAKYWLSTGIIRGTTSELAVYADSTGMQVKVSAGEAYVEGTRFASNAVETLPISTADATNPRIDLVVLRLDTVAGTVDFAVLTGTAAVSPVAPTPTQTTTRWELPLAQVAVAAAAATIAAANTTDRRTYAGKRALQESGGVNNLVNPGLEVWQRGAGPFTAQLAFTADRWQIATSGTSTMSISRDGTNVDRGSQYAAAITYTQGDLASRFRQTVEEYVQLRGRVITVALRVRTATANAVRAFIYDPTLGYRYGAFHTGGAGWETLFCSAVIDAAATYILVGVELSASGSIYVDSATLAVGSEALAFAPLPPADDLARCQRYYERHGQRASEGFPELVAWAGTAELYGVPISFATTKGGTPTVTKGGTWTVANCGQPSPGAQSYDGYTLSATATAAGRMVVYPDTVDDYIAAEWNP